MSAQPTRKQKAANRGFFGMTVSRPIAMGVIFVTLVLLGVIAYTRIPLQFLPGGIQGSRFTVIVPNPGSTAQENVDKVARILEEQFSTLPEIDEISSRSSAGTVRIRVKYNGEANTDLAKAELRDRIERARPELPDTVDEIYVWASDDGDMPIMWFAIVADERSDDIATLIDKRVQKSLEAVDGVSRVNIFGLLDESIRIFLDEEKVAAARLDLGSLVQRLSTDNFAQPLGEVSEGGREFILRSDMRFKDLDDIRQYPVRPGLRLGELATVERVNSVRDRVTRINGGYAYYGMVQKEGSANVVAVGEELQAVMDGFETDPRLEGKLKAEVFFNQADFIKSSLERLEGTAVQGGGLAVLVLFLFLRRARMTFCVALCIPVSALLAIAFESARGLSFNVLTMTGLTLGIGMLVDNAVVVIESIARQRSLGESPKRSAVLGARDVGLAVSLATMTTVVVFLPLIFMGGQRMSIFLQAMGVPLCASLIFSLFVALFFIPTAAARVIGERPAWAQRIADRMAPVVAAPARLLAYTIGAARMAAFVVFWVLFRIEKMVLRVAGSPLRFALACGVVYLGIRAGSEVSDLGSVGKDLESLGAPAGTVGTLMKTGPILQWVPRILAAIIVFLLPHLWKRAARGPARPESFVPEGTSVVAWVQALNRSLLEWTLAHRPLAFLLSVIAAFSIVIPATNTSLTAFGDDEDTSELSFDVDLENNFTLGEASREIQRYEEFVEPLKEEMGFENVVARFDSGGGDVDLRWAERLDPKVLEAHRTRLRSILPKFAGHRVSFSGDPAAAEGSKQFVSFELRGTDPDKLSDLGEAAVAILEKVPGLTDVRTATEDAPDQLLLEVDGDTAFSYGLNSQSALRNVGWALRGSQLPRFQEEDKETPLIIEYDDTAYAGLDTLKDLSVWGENGAVPLATFSTIRFEPSPSSISRRNGQISFQITARVADPTRQAELVEEGYAALDGLDLPRGYSLGRDTSVVTQGLQEMKDLANAGYLAIVLVFLLMGILFESVLLPLSVLTTIPFAGLGAFWTLYITGTPMDSIGYIGIIILVGVVVNNGIVLIDKIHRLRLEEGLPRKDAVIEGASARVRPILMTALTTVFGLLPMAMGDAPTQGIDYRALSTCVAGGLAICTFFTLWVVPLAYTLIDDLSLWLTWLFQRVFSSGKRGEGLRFATEDMTAIRSLVIRDSRG
ncbi:Multidrug resistance protein MdtB [Planctomycetes bacterium Poly30]|uniref:Multidrug resistance protein MdtB n=1 Tax=Saltatorellus ferox TaxID=2528018 RepID=A0A518EQW7_9BACT|nr:Multidrug resistance protein MdtB [Planctomycetes bacterium Poly30]